MEKKVLVPTNFSKYAWNALIYGLDLYKDEPCTFYLFNAYSSKNLLPDNLNLVKDEEEETPESKSEEGLDRLISGISFRKENPNHKFEKISHKGALTRGIQEAVDTYAMDLILMGSKGDTAAINSAYNNSISKVVEKVNNCPIFVIPETVKLIDEDYREIVFPTNLGYTCKQREVMSLIDIAKGMDAGIRALYINTDDKPLTEEQESVKENLYQLFSDTEFSFHILVNTTQTTGVDLFIQSRQSDILALYKRKKGFFTKLFNQAVKEEIDFNTKVPILVLKEIEED